jgi:pilus assembly protein CpaB
VLSSSKKDSGQPHYGDSGEAMRLKRPELYILIIAIVLGLVSASLSESHRNAKMQEALKNYQTKKVLVAASNLTAGIQLDSKSFVEKEVLASSVTGSMVSLEEQPAILGKRLLIDMKKGDPLLLTMVIANLRDDSIAGNIPSGKRLVSLKIVDSIARNGWIRPNDRVDIITSIELPGRGKTTFTLLRDITLISVGQATVWERGVASKGTEVSFYATPEDVEFINYAQEMGTFSLALRNPEEQESAPRVKGGEFFRESGVDMQKFMEHKAVRDVLPSIPVTIKGEASDRRQTR